MKQIVSNYTYSPTTNVVTLTGVNIDADQLLLIVAPQVGRTLYNFASGVTGAVSAGANTRVSLNASTAGLTTTSPLVIFYDDQASTQTIAGTVTANVQNLVREDYDALGFYGVPAMGKNSDNDTYKILKTDQDGILAISLPNGALTTRFGSVATASLAFITSAVTNTSRKYLLAQNISAGTVTIGIGFSPTTTQGIQLAAGGGLTFDAFCPTGAVYWLGAVTGAAFTILEG